MKDAPNNKTVIVTGASRGLGRAIAVRLTGDGYNVVLNFSSDVVGAREALAECLSVGPNAVLMQADVACKKEVERLVYETCRKFGSVEGLVNNAGRNIDRHLHEMTEGEWDLVVNTNMKGVFLCSQAVSARMLRQDQGGVILNVGASTGIRGRVKGLNYCASKAGVLVMTKCLALELAPKIRVNCIIPGLIETAEAVERFGLGVPELRREREREIPLARIGSAAEVADAAAFLLSDASKYINGQKIIIDGGQFMY